MTKTYPIISLNGFLYAIENEQSKYTGNPKHVFCTAAPNDFGGLRKNCITGLCELCRDVVASNDPSLTDIPKLPEMQEDLDILAKKAIQGQDVPAIDMRNGFKLGYKAASNKRYTEEDMRKAMLFAWTCGTDKKKPEIDWYIGTLNPIPKEVELEMEANIPPRYNHTPKEDDFLIRPKVENGFVIVKSWKY